MKLKKIPFQSHTPAAALFTFIALSLSLAFVSPNRARAEKKWGIEEDILGMCFPTEKEGWACGRWGRILYTADGGASWTVQESGTDFTLTSLCFVDARNGWAVGNEGTIIHTADGGATWSRQNTPVDYYLMDVHFVTPLKGWIVTQETHILHTADGGENWSVRFTDEMYTLKAVDFCDELHGWAVGEYEYIYHTSDGGRTWEKQRGYFDINDETGLLEGGTLLYDVVALGPLSAWAAGMDGYIIHTEDGGKTWQQIVTGTPEAHLFFIAHDGAEIFVAGGKGLCVFSKDNGRNWDVAGFDPSISYSWIYAGASLGACRFAVGGENGALYLTADAETWNRVR